ncbi:serine-type D-Ala-D-Ala carboxypeptidase [Vibrio profundum]|uniref:serine-type D-Ala-D-Ala carboxypeptidase n=1 Tax=Vibrio profundum TaxID=2910247 RepID=UPI003D0B3106
MLFSRCRFSRLHLPFISTVFCFVSLLTSSLTFAYTPSYSPSKQLPTGARHYLRVQDLQDDTTLLRSGQDGNFFPPASTLKLVTALAAKLELGDKFHFQTTLSQAGQDLVLRFSGDPTLTSGDLAELLKQAKQQGIRHIRGDIWLDNSVFTGYQSAVGLPWDILGVCYSAPAMGIVLNHNCVQASISTSSPQSGKHRQTRFYVPEHQPIHVVNQVIAVSKEEKKALHCDLELTTGDNNHYRLAGCLVKSERVMPLNFAIQQPALYTQRVLSRLLQQQGITLDGQIRVGVPPHQGAVIAEHDSKPLPELLDVMLKKSDNLIADTLTKTLGARYFHQAGSFTNGTEAIKAIIKMHTGIDLERDQLVDGSGLSRNDRVHPKDLMAILRYIWQHDATLKLIELMPVSGESGTLQYRRSMRKAPIEGNLIAKSGTLYGSHNMAGFGLDAHGQPRTLFVQYITDYFVPESESEKPIEAPITRFEKLFYRDVVNLSQTVATQTAHQPIKSEENGNPIQRP